MDVVVVVQGDAELLQVVDALGATGGLAGRLDGGQEQGDQDGDDRDHHQQLDQREAANVAAAGLSMRSARQGSPSGSSGRDLVVRGRNRGEGPDGVAESAIARAEGRRTKGGDRRSSSTLVVASTRCRDRPDVGHRLRSINGHARHTAGPMRVRGGQGSRPPT